MSRSTHNYSHLIVSGLEFLMLLGKKIVANDSYRTRRRRKVTAGENYTDVVFCQLIG